MKRYSCAVKNCPALQASILLVPSGLQTAPMVKVAVLVAGNVAQDRPLAAVVTADAFGYRKLAVEKTETQSSASRTGLSLCFPFGKCSTMKCL
jgi:hypothetical protein